MGTGHLDHIEAREGIIIIRNARGQVPVAFDMRPGEWPDMLLEDRGVGVVPPLRSVTFDHGGRRAVLEVLLLDSHHLQRFSQVQYRVELKQKSEITICSLVVQCFWRASDGMVHIA